MEPLTLSLIVAAIIMRAIGGAGKAAASQLSGANARRRAEESLANKPSDDLGPRWGTWAHIVQRRREGKNPLLTLLEAGVVGVRTAAGTPWYLGNFVKEVRKGWDEGWAKAKERYLPQRDEDPDGQDEQPPPGGNGPDDDSPYERRRPEPEADEEPQWEPPDFGDQESPRDEGSQKRDRQSEEEPRSWRRERGPDEEYDVEVTVIRKPRPEPEPPGQVSPPPPQYALTPGEIMNEQTGPQQGGGSPAAPVPSWPEPPAIATANDTANDRPKVGSQVDGTRSSRRAPAAIGDVHSYEVARANGRRIQEIIKSLDGPLRELSDLVGEAKKGCGAQIDGMSSAGVGGKVLAAYLEVLDAMNVLQSRGRRMVEAATDALDRADAAAKTNARLGQPLAEAVRAGGRSVARETKYYR